MTRRRRFSAPSFFVVAFLLLLILAQGKVAESTECDRRLKRSDRADVVDNFRHFLSKRFYGQDDAIDIVTSALRRFRSSKWVMLHFVGDAGTGKTFLAEILARSFFSVEQCRKFDEFSQNGVLDNLPCIFKQEVYEIPVLYAGCGVGYADLLRSIGSTISAQQMIEEAFERALDSWTATEERPYVIVLDNVDNCKGECDHFLSNLVSNEGFRRKDNSYATLDKMIIIMTSDLSREGLKISAHDDKLVAIAKILDASRSVWDPSSTWNDHAFIVPFAPYTDQELVKILEMVIEKVTERVRLHINRALEDHKKSLNMGVLGTVRWVGRFRFSEQEKIRLVDRVHNEVAKRNCRAFAVVESKLNAATRWPEPIEVSLLKHRPISEQSKWPKWLKSAFSHLPGPSNSDDVQYGQNIIFRVVDDDRMVVAEIEDVDEIIRPRSSLEL